MTVAQRAGYAAPVVKTATVTGLQAVTASYGTLPKTAGDLYVALVTGYGTTTSGPITETTGTWVELATQDTATRVSGGIFVQVAAGGDAAPIFNCTFTGTASHIRFVVMLVELYDSGGGTPAYDPALSGQAFVNSGATSLTPVTTAVVPVAGCFGVSGFVQGYSTATAAKTFTRSTGWSALGADNTGTIYSHSGFDYSSTAPGAGTTDSNVMGWGSGTINGACAGIAIFTPPPKQSPGLELYGFSISGPGPADTINSVTVAVTEHQSNAAQQPCSIQLWDGTSAQIGATATGTASTSGANVSTATFTGVTYSQLATLRVRVYGSSLVSGYIESVDGVSLSVNYAPSPDALATPTTLAVTTAFPAPAVTAVSGPAPAKLQTTTAFPAPAVNVFVSPYLEIAGFGSFTGVISSSIINTVTVAITEYQSVSSMPANTFELWDYSGAPAKIGSTQTGIASTSSANVDTAVYTGVVTYAQLATLRVRVYAHSGNTASGTAYVDSVGLTVNYSLSPDATATPAALTVTVAFPAPAVTGGTVTAPRALLYPSLIRAVDRASTW